MRRSLTTIVQTLLCCLPALCHSEITPESVLGEYWKDPLFGKAATEETVELRLLNSNISPSFADIPTHKNVQFIFDNRSEEAHLIVFTSDPDDLLSDADVQANAADILLHSPSNDSAAPHHHHHHHQGGSVDDAKDIVKTLEDKPLLYVPPGARKEILMRFHEEEVVYALCILGDHLSDKHLSRLNLHDPNKESFQSDSAK